MVCKCHEIGHLLLGSQRHSDNGLMRVRWSRSDWRLAAVQQLRFSRQEGIAMQSELAKRIKQLTADTLRLWAGM